MAENLIIPKEATKAEIYQSLLPQIKALIASEKNLIANLANVSAVLKEAFDFFWVGFYMVEKDELVLGPFQGPLACTRIGFGKGVCGAAWKERKAILVADVEKFPGHIACSAESKSEIVIPIFKGNEVVLVLDIDSKNLNAFHKEDEKHLTDLAKIISETIA
jgi:GAF domain-containing protein